MTKIDEQFNELVKEYGKQLLEQTGQELGARKAKYEEGNRQARAIILEKYRLAVLERLRELIDDSVEDKDGIVCDWTEDAYNRVNAIIDQVEKEFSKK